MKTQIAEEYVHIPDLKWIPFPPTLSAGGIRWKLLHVQPGHGAWTAIFDCPKGSRDLSETVFAYAMTEVDPGTFGNIFDAIKDKLSILAGLKLNAPEARLTINIMTMVSFLIIAIGLIKMNYEQQTALISQSVPTSVKFKNVRKTRN